MTLLKGFVKMDKDGQIKIPKNIAREAALKEGQLVEIRISGPIQRRYIVVRRTKRIG